MGGDGGGTTGVRDDVGVVTAGDCVGTGVAGLGVGRSGLLVALIRKKEDSKRKK